MLNGRVRVMTDRLVAIVALLVLWQAGSLIVGAYGLPSPAATFDRLLSDLETAWFWTHFVATLHALLHAAAITVLGGLTLGAWLGANRFAGGVAEPILTSLYSLPKITLYPLILLIFGIGFDAKVALGALHGIIPCTLFTASAIRTIPAIYTRAGVAMGMGRREIVRTIMLPAALPEVLTGIRVGLSLTLLGTLIGEMFASQAGMGFMLRDAMERIDAAAITGLAVFLMIFALLLNAGIVTICHALRVPGMAHLKSRTDPAPK